MLKTLAFGAAALSLAAASAAQAEPSNCLNLSTLQSTRVADEHTVYMRASDRGIYRVDFAGGCSTAPNEALVVHAVGDDRLICRPIQLDIHVRASGQACIATGFTRLTPDEVAALPKSVLP